MKRTLITLGSSNDSQPDQLAQALGLFDDIIVYTETALMPHLASGDRLLWRITCIESSIASVKAQIFWMRPVDATLSFGRIINGDSGTTEEPQFALHATCNPIFYKPDTDNFFEDLRLRGTMPNAKAVVDYISEQLVKKK